MDNLYWLDRIQLSEHPLVGNQAFNLSRLLQRGYPVVQGFVVPAIAFWELIKILGKSEPLLADLPHSSFHVDVDNPQQLQQVAQHIRQLILTAALPTEWISSLFTATERVQASAMIFQPSLSLPSKKLQLGKLLAQHRAAQVDASNLPIGFSSEVQSATPSTLQLSDLQASGILESHIGLKQPEALALSLKRVWAELFRARSLFYWQRNGIGLHQINLAVLVQPMCDAIASGTLETGSTQWNIQATWGLPTALTKGEVLPDVYQLHPETTTVQSQLLGNKTRAYRLSNVNVSEESLRDSAQAAPDSETLPTQGASDLAYTLGDTSFRATQEASSAQHLLRASERQEPYTPTVSGLQPYLVSEEQQKQYALEEGYLKQLIEMSRRLSAELNSTFYLEWTLCQIPGSPEAKLYLTKFNPQAKSISSQLFMSTQPSPPKNTSVLVRGLPAAAGRVTAPAQVIIGAHYNMEAMLPGRILVAQSVAPDWLPWLRQAVGIITEKGGMTSHAAIMARELGIPAVVGAAGVTQLIQTGEPIAVDGERGEIQRLRSGDCNVETGTCLLPAPQLSRSPASLYPYPIATQLLVNLSQPNFLDRIATLPVDGIGLLRSELMMLNALENLHYSEWLRRGHKSELVARLAQIIIQFAAAFAPRPVFYRSLDWRSHEFQFLAGATVPPEPELNPALGLRGTRLYLSDPTYFDLELAALAEVHASGYTNIKLILPFVRTVEEFTFCRRRVEQAGLFDNPHFQLSIMAEVPSILFLLPDYVKAGIQGISIGTNDLTQLLLAVDRDQGQLGSTLDVRHPAVMRALQQIIQIAKRVDIPCSICGQAPSQYPEIIQPLVEWGITSISVDVNDVEQTYTAIARAEQRLLLEAARRKIDHSNHQI